MAAEKVELRGANLSAVLGKKLLDSHIGAKSNVLTQDLNSSVGLTEHSSFIPMPFAPAATPKTPEWQRLTLTICICVSPTVSC
jgi:hypothetical protein